MARAKSGGGITSNKLVHPGIKTGAPSRATSPEAAAQLGTSTHFPKKPIETGRGYNGAKYGNEVALNVGRGGPGTGRDVHRCGSQGTHGAVNPGHSPQRQDILSAYGPDIRGRK